MNSGVIDLFIDFLYQGRHARPPQPTADHAQEHGAADCTAPPDVKGDGRTAGPDRLARGRGAA